MLRYQTGLCDVACDMERGREEPWMRYTEGQGLPPYALKGLVNHKLPNSDVAGGYLKLTPEGLREPAQQVEDMLLHSG